MKSIIVNTENSKTNEPYRYRLPLTHELHLTDPNKNMLLVNYALNQNTTTMNLKYLLQHEMMNVICLKDHILLHKSKIILRILLRSMKPYEITRQYKLDYRLQIRTAVAINSEINGEC